MLPQPPQPTDTLTAPTGAQIVQAPHRADITGLVLAGGRGLRMGGVDKGLQRLGGEALVTRALARLAPQVGHLHVSANQNLVVYRSILGGFERGGSVLTDDAAPGAGLRTSEDPTPDWGPLGGILAGLRACETPFLAICAVDCPQLPPNWVATLARAFTPDCPPVPRPTPLQVSLAATRQQDRLQPEPLVALLRVTPTLIQGLAAYLATGERRVGAWMLALAHHLQPMDAQDAGAAFANLNTLQALQALDAALTRPEAAPPRA